MKKKIDLHHMTLCECLQLIQFFHVIYTDVKLENSLTSFILLLLCTITSDTMLDLLFLFLALSKETCTFCLRFGSARIEKKPPGINKCHLGIKVRRQDERLFGNYYAKQKECRRQNNVKTKFVYLNIIAFFIF